MKLIFKIPSIKQKLVLINLLTTGFAFLIAGIVFIIGEFISSRGELLDNLNIQAKIIGTNSTASLIFNDQKTAGEILSALRASPGIECAAVYSKNGKVFASYQRDDDNFLFPAPQKAGYYFAGYHLNLFQSVVLDNETIGTLYIRSNLKKLYLYILWDGVIAVAIIMVAGGVAFLLLSKLQKTITEPISHLSQLMQKVSRDKDYSVRSKILSQDEIGSLSNGFNEMLEQIQDQDMTLREYTENLEQRVRERTQELDDARRTSEAANVAKSDFLANMSHELRTPLNSIIGFSEVMRDGMAGTLTEEQKEYLKDIWESGKHLLGLINDILDLSKVEAGKMELELSEFNLKELIDGSLVMFKEKALKHNVKIAAEVEEGIADIMADGRKLKQVLFNLISNAIKFTPDGGYVTVQARKIHDAGYMIQDTPLSPPPVTGEVKGGVHPDSDFIEISVEDTGIGISLDNQKRLFQPFQQLETTLTKKYEGTGLGLALSRRMVGLHGGRIRVESEAGKGSKFIFTIPVKI